MALKLRSPSEILILYQASFRQRIFPESCLMTSEDNSFCDDDSAGTEPEIDEIQQFALTDDGLLKVYRVGPTTVLGFAGQDIPSEFNVVHHRAAIFDLLKLHQSSVVAFDLTGVGLVPSGMLGLLVSLKKLEGIHPVVQVFNPSVDVREVLRLSRLDTLIEIHEVDVSEDGA